MINSLLQDMPYSEIMAIRKHFNIKCRESVKCEFDYDKPEYIKYKKILDEIDEVLLAKYIFDNNNFYNYSQNVSN